MPCFPVLPPCFLEPLEEFPLIVPFPEAHLESSRPGALGLFNETPSTIDMSLPTPNIPVFTVFTDELPSPAQVHYDTPPPQSEAIQPPPAPLIKDMDSFSDGTTQGSFDLTMSSDHGDGQVPSVAFSPSHPTRSIEIWRDDVVRNTTVERQEGHPSRGDEDGHIIEPATKRRRLSLFPPTAEEERPTTAPIMRRAQSLPPNSLCLIRDGDDRDHSAAPPPVAVSRPCSAPPTLA